MKIGSIPKFVISIPLLFITHISSGQNPVNWTREQLMEPAQLAQMIQNNQSLPVIFSVGPGSLIPHSIAIGSVSDAEHFAQLKKQLSTLPKDTSIIVYCGCCPFEHCPNARPAVQVLKEMGFTNFKLLNLEHNIKADWIDKGYPKVP